MTKDQSTFICDCDCMRLFHLKCFDLSSLIRIKQFYFQYGNVDYKRYRTVSLPAEELKFSYRLIYFLCYAFQVLLIRLFIF